MVLEPGGESLPRSSVTMTAAPPGHHDVVSVERLRQRPESENDSTQMFDLTTYALACTYCMNDNTTHEHQVWLAICTARYSNYSLTKFI